MPEYDFHQLSPHDLEVLTRDLLQAHWGVDIESFKAGRDGGIDLRYAAGPSKTIIQVKHYLRTGLNSLPFELQPSAALLPQLIASNGVGGLNRFQWEDFQNANRINADVFASPFTTILTIATEDRSRQGIERVGEVGRRIWPYHGCLEYRAQILTDQVGSRERRFC